MQPTQQRKQEVLASNLLLGSFLLNLALFYYGSLLLHKPAHSDDILNPWVTAPANVLTLGWYYTVRKGKQWTKILLLILVIFALIHSLTTHRKVVILAHMNADGLYTARMVISYVVYLIALGLLFYKPKPIITIAQP
jgi:hypothetical protein